MDCKYTPGPWTVRYDYVVQAPSFDDGRLVPVAQPYGVNSDGTDLFANARLIAAAPDLLDACRVMLDHVGYASCESSVQRQGLQKMLRAAIAKATGQTGPDMQTLSDYRDDATRTADHGHFAHEGTGPNYAELVEEAKQEILRALRRDLCLIWIHGGTRGRPWPVADQLYDITGAHLGQLFSDACAAGQSGKTFGQIGEAFWRWQQASIAALAESIADHRMDGGRAVWVQREVSQ